MEPSIGLTPEYVAERVVQHILSTGKKFVFLSGNGGAGKTELCKHIVRKALKHGNANAIDMDDFVVGTTLRNNATATWTDPVTGPQTGRYTTAFSESYFLQNVNAILYNIERGNDYYHWPKKAVSGDECSLLRGDAVITVVDGCGTVYLRKRLGDSLSLFMECSEEIEIARRTARKRFSNEQQASDVQKNIAVRNSQYRALIQPHIAEYSIVLESLEDFSVTVVRDDISIL